MMAWKWNTKDVREVAIEIGRVTSIEQNPCICSKGHKISSKEKKKEMQFRELGDSFIGSAETCIYNGIGDFIIESCLLSAGKQLNLVKLVNY